MGIPVLAVPTYEITLPASKKQIKFRPFVVKEEKIFLMAMEQGDESNVLRAMDDVINACTFGVCHIKDLPQVDVEYLFIQLRAKSLGETMDITATCPCGKEENLTANLDDIKITYPEKEMKSEIQLSDNCWVSMSYPTLDMTYKLNTQDATKYDTDEIVAKCIKSIIIGEHLYEPKDFKPEETIEWVGALNKPQLEKLKEYFKSTPSLQYTASFTCKVCETKNNIVIEGLSDFFD